MSFLTKSLASTFISNFRSSCELTSMPFNDVSSLIIFSLVLCSKLIGGSSSLSAQSLPPLSFGSEAIERLRSSLKRSSYYFVRSKRDSIAMSVDDLTRCLMSSYLSKWSAARYPSLTTFASRRQSQLQVQKERIVESFGSFTN